MTSDKLLNVHAGKGGGCGVLMQFIAYENYKLNESWK